MTPYDPFVALWQTAPKPDTLQLLHDLQRHTQRHRRFNGTLAAIFAVVSLLLLSEETNGRLATHGWMSMAWLLCLAAGGFWHWRVRGRRADVRDRDTVSLLKAMVRQAKTDLFLARCLYAGVPLGAVFGYLITKFAGLRPAHPSPVADSQLHLVQTGVAIAVLIAMVVSGVVLARSRRIQAEELAEKLKLIDTGV